jgi:hypothetical protein
MYNYIVFRSYMKNFSEHYGMKSAKDLCNLFRSSYLVVRRGSEIFDQFYNSNKILSCHEKCETSFI